MWNKVSCHALLLTITILQDVAIGKSLILINFLTLFFIFPLFQLFQPPTKLLDDNCIQKYTTKQKKQNLRKSAHYKLSVMIKTRLVPSITQQNKVLTI